MAAQDLCQLEDVKAWISVPDSVSANDDMLARLITATSYDFLREINRPDFFPAQDYTETREGDGGDSIVLRHWPLNSVEDVRINDVSLPRDPTYYIDLDLDPERRWELYLSSPTNPVFPDGSKVGIDYNAGYETVPGDVEQAVIDWVAYRFRARQWIGQTEQAQYQNLTTRTPEIEIPMSVKRVIERYRRFDPLQTPPERIPEANAKLSKQVISVNPKGA